MKQDTSKAKEGELRPEECEEAENYWVREAQGNLNRLPTRINPFSMKGDRLIAY